MAINGRATRAVLAIGAAGMLAAGVAACGGDDSGSSSSGGGGGSSSKDEQVTIGLITKTESNPFFVKMKEGAQAAAKENNVKLLTASGKSDTDNQSQVTAIENMTTQGAKVILDVPADSKAIVPAIKKARDAGVLVIALDTPTEPADATDATFATDNYAAGLAIGKWAKGTFEKDGKQAKIALLDLNANQVSVDVQRDQGFLEGFGVDVADNNKIGDESDPRIAGHDVTDGAEDGGRTAMENLLQKDPSINLVYTINEPAAAGAFQAIKAAGKEKDVTVVSVDGGCPGVDNVKAGAIGATSMQFPLKMAEEGVTAVAAFAKDGKKPEATAGKDFVDTGVTLITDQPQAGVDGKDSTWGKENCWG